MTLTPPSRLSLTDSALEGFKITREHPGALLIWAILQFASALITAVAILGFGGPGAKLLQDMMTAPTVADPQKMAGAFTQMGPVLALLVILGLFVSVLLYNAILRSVLKPEERRFGYLRLSMEEVRQAALAILFMVLLTFYSGILSAVSQLLIAGAGALGVLARPFSVLVVAALVCAFVYPAVRLSLAPALVLIDGRINLRRAWGLTEGRFWSLFGCYLFAVALAVVVWVAGLLILALAASLLGLTGNDLAGGLDLTHPLNLSNLVGVANAMAGAILYSLVYIIIASPGAVLARALVGDQGAEGRPDPVVTPARPGAPWGGRP